LCDKYKWANKNAILWDGVMNTNQCWRGTKVTPSTPSFDRLLSPFILIKWMMLDNLTVFICWVFWWNVLVLEK
jgi:hypothetical protein